MIDERRQCVKDDVPYASTTRYIDVHQQQQRARVALRDDDVRDDEDDIY